MEGSAKRDEGGVHEEHAFLDNSTLVPCSCQNQKVQMFKVMRSWFGDTETIRDAYRDAAWFNGNFDSSVQQCVHLSSVWRKR